MSDRPAKAILAVTIGLLAVVLSAAVPRPATQQTVTGQTYTYGCQDISREFVRSNGGSRMQDFLPVAGTACLSRGATLTIRNADPRGWLYLYGTLVQYPNGIRRGHNQANNDMTFVEGGVLFGGGCPMCLSVTFIGPGQRATFAYDDRTQTFPNGTIGDCQGCAPDMKIHGPTWRLRGRLRAGEMRPRFSSSPKQEEWTPYPQSKCCTCVRFALWNSGWNGCNSGAPWALNTAHDSVRGDVMRLEMRQGDHWWNDAEQGKWSIERSLAEGTKLSNGTTWWEAYSFLLECGAPVGSDGRSSGNYWLIIEDIHSDPKIQNGVVPIQTELLPGGYFAINARVQGGNSQNYIYIAPTPLACGTWHDVVRQFDIDPSGGFLREWLDGQQIVDFMGRLGDPGDTPYPEFELYRADYYGVANTYAERIANVQLGTASLAGRIGNPPVSGVQ